MRKTLIMILIAVGLASYVYFYEIKGGEQREQQKAAAEKLVALEKDSVDYVHIKTMYSEFEFLKEKDGWQITKPLQTSADETPLNTLISGLTNAKKERSFVVPEKERSNFGLGPRALTVELKTKSGEQTQIRMGEATNIGSNVYMASGDSLVHLVNSSVKTNAQKSLFDWRDKKVLHFDKKMVREIQLSGPAENISLLKENEKWKITQPIETTADQSTISGFLDKLDYGKMKAVASESDKDQKKYLGKRGLNIKLLLGPDKAEKRIHFSELVGNKAYGKDDSRPQIFQVDSSFMKPLLKSLFDFRDKSIVTFEQNQSTRISYTIDKNMIDLQKDTSGTWFGADSLKAKSWKVSGLLSSLKSLKASGFNVPIRTSLFDQPTAEIKVYSGSDLLADLAVIKKDDKSVFVFNRSSALKARIEAADMKNLFPEKSELFEQPKQEEKK